MLAKLDGTLNRIESLFNDDFLTMPINYVKEFSFTPQKPYLKSCFESLPNEHVITVEVPGVDREDIGVEFRDDHIEISVEKKKTNNISTATVSVSEISYGKASRSFRVPTNVDREKIDAELKNGVLRVVLPVSEEKKKKLIDIKTG